MTNDTVRRSWFAVLRSKFVLEDLIWFEAADLQIELGGGVERRGWDQPDDLAFQNRHAVALGLALHRFEHPKNRRLFVVRQVHRDLHDAAVFELEAGCLD